MNSPLPRHGFAVQIARKDGTKFLSCSAHGDASPVWCKGNRKWAVAWKRELRAAGFKATVVPVIYYDPQVLTS